MKFENKTFSEKIKELREAKGITQGELSRLSGVSVAEICRIEKGERQNPSINLLNKLLSALEVDIDTYVKVTGFEEK
jgi:transcriptional regulator with XRE-family HTH domain